MYAKCSARCLTSGKYHVSVGEEDQMMQGVKGEIKSREPAMVAAEGNRKCLRI